MVSVQDASLSSMTTRVVTVGSTTGNGFGGPDNYRDVVFGGAEDRTRDDLDGFNFDGVAEQGFSTKDGFEEERKEEEDGE